MFHAGRQTDRLTDIKTGLKRNPWAKYRVLVEGVKAASTCIYQYDLQI